MGKPQDVMIDTVGAVEKKGRDIGEVSQFTLMRWRFKENKLAVAGGIVLIIMYLIAALAPFLSPYDYDEIDTGHKEEVKVVG